MIRLWFTIASRESKHFRSSVTVQCCLRNISVYKRCILSRETQLEKLMFLKKLLRFHRPKRTLYSKKYGVAQIQYTHATNTVIHTSTKIDGKLKACFLNHLSFIQMQN